ncbi:MAG TPA: DUF2255 family protein [Candidatus Limnocylindria bacterium]|nr:DUF2255 family protein [Candidatus Limnocylindria bacterium]
MAFPKDVLGLLDRTKEVDVETHSAEGKRHRVPIWIVVDGDDVFARSWRGSTARWYRELTARDGVLVAGRQRIPVHAVGAVDRDSVRRTSDGYQKKYPKSDSTPSMLRSEILDTTIRLEPVDQR